METNSINNPEPISLPQSIPTPPQNIYKTLFFIFLGLFIVSTSILVYFLFSFTKTYVQPESKTPEVVISTPSPTSEPSPIATESTTATTSAKTPFQKLIVNFTLYKELTTTEKNASFNTPGGFWTSSLTTEDPNYIFAQKLIKGSIKKLTISKSNLSTILGDYTYTFYITPNYENFSNEKFKEKNLFPMTGISDLNTLWAYPDKLIWTTVYPSACGGAEATTVADKKAQDQCNELTKEVNYAFL
jgi:hypothetical protein